MKKTKNESVLEEEIKKCIYFHITFSKANEEQLEILASSISKIKIISQGIGEQVKEDNRVIGGMERNMIQGKQMMIKTMNKLDQVLNSKSGNIIFYTIFFILLVFMVLYKWTRS